MVPVGEVSSAPLAQVVLGVRVVRVLLIVVLLLLRWGLLLLLLTVVLRLSVRLLRLRLTVLTVLLRLLVVLCGVLGRVPCSVVAGADVTVDGGVGGDSMLYVPQGVLNKI